MEPESAESRVGYLRPKRMSARDGRLPHTAGGALLGLVFFHSEYSMGTFSGLPNGSYSMIVLRQLSQQCIISRFSTYRCSSRTQ